MNVSFAVAQGMNTKAYSSLFSFQSGGDGREMGGLRYSIGAQSQYPTSEHAPQSYQVLKKVLVERSIMLVWDL